MAVLGISSATKIISIGLIDKDKVLAETTLADCRTEKITFYIKEAGIEPQQIEAVAVADGPGSYSGLRGGLATAKSLAHSLQVPLIGISTLEAIAYNLADIEGTMAVVLDARLDEYNLALFGAADGKIKRLTDDIVIKLDQLIAKLGQISGKLWIVGSVTEIKAKLIGNNYHFADDIHSHPYGSNVAKLGSIKLKAGQADDPLTLAPKYSHKPNIREFKR